MDGFCCRSVSKIHYVLHATKWQQMLAYDAICSMCWHMPACAAHAGWWLHTLAYTSICQHEQHMLADANNCQNVLDTHQRQVTHHVKHMSAYAAHALGRLETFDWFSQREIHSTKAGVWCNVWPFYPLCWLGLGNIMYYGVYPLIIKGKTTQCEGCKFDG